MQWIAVSERLPEPGKAVAAWNAAQLTPVVAVWNRSIGWHYVKSCFAAKVVGAASSFFPHTYAMIEDYGADRITHWCELPGRPSDKPPSEKIVDIPEPLF